MTEYTLEYADGRPAEEIIAATDQDAVTCLRRILPGAVLADEWDQRQRGRRRLIWTDGAEASDDDGSKAVAQLVAVDDTDEIDD